MAVRIEPKVLAELTDHREICISPDGEKVVYASRPVNVRESEHIRSSIWLAEVGKENSSRRLTQGRFNDFSPQFSPDGKHVSFLSDRSKPGRSVVLYLLPLAGGEAYPLTSEDDEMGVGAYMWRPDGEAIAYTKADEKSEERKQKEKDKNDANVYDEDVDLARVRIINVESKEIRSFESIKGHVSQLCWNPDGTKLACGTLKSPNMEDWFTGTRIYILDSETDSSKDLAYYPSMIIDLCWCDKQLMWSGGVELGSRTTGTGVYALSTDDGDQGMEVVAHGTEDCAAGIKFRNQKVVVQVRQGLDDVLEILDGEELYKARQNISAWDAHVRSDRKALVICTSKTGIPSEVFSIVGGKETQLSQHGKDVAAMNIGKAYSCQYTHEDGTPIDGFYAVPSSLQEAFSKGEPQPTVLVVHGGPYMRINESFDVMWQWNAFLLSLGYLVLCPNYRGGSSHGHDYANAVRHNAAASYQDIIWLVKQGIKEKKIDPDRVAIMGWSQGGYLSYLAVTRDDQFHFRAAMAGAGVTEWTTMALTSDVPTVESEMSGEQPWNLTDINEVVSRKSSPIYQVQNVRTPLLIIHGEQDRRTPIEQAVGFYRGMKAKGKDVTLVVYPREEHGFQMPWEKAHFIDMLERIEAFLGKHMK